jgi:ATP-dependent DNA helicase DinG
VILSAAMPSRLHSAFPPEVPVRRITLDGAIEAVKCRLGKDRAVGVAASPVPAPAGGQPEP